MDAKITYLSYKNLVITLDGTYDITKGVFAGKFSVLNDEDNVFLIDRKNKSRNKFTLVGHDF